ncbi:MAG TPA: metallophosphoesterase [Nitrospira sp.]|nr:metallophosphoesterase [Nitrospira sp.]
MRAAWLTDIHLDFLSPPARQDFFAAVASKDPDMVFLTGDVSVAPYLVTHLSEFCKAINKPVYFVLGNHDFYNGSIKDVRATVRNFCRTHPLLNYLADAKIVALSPSTALVGHDGWGDGRYGNYAKSSVRLNDHLLIKELTGLTSSNLQQQLMRLGNEAADYLRILLPDALNRYQHVILLTHVPPFRESCWYQGHVSNDDWLPFFACQSVGDVLREEMDKRPDQQLTVYCGHTHNGGTAQILPNLRVFTGAAEYGAPQINEVLTIA